MSRNPRHNSEPKGAMETLRDTANSTTGKLILLGTTAVGLLTGCAPGEAPKTPQESSIVTPGPEVTVGPEVVDLSKFNFELDATPEQLGQNYANLITFQDTGNINASLKDLYFNTEKYATMPIEDFALEMATKHVEATFNAHYKPGWREDESLMAHFNLLVKNNIANIKTYITDPSALKVSYSVNSSEFFEGESESSLIVSHTLNYRGLPIDQNAEKLNGQVLVEELTLSPQDNRFVISDRQARLDQ